MGNLNYINLYFLEFFILKSEKLWNFIKILILYKNLVFRNLN
jgi:hypothetical protein